jgi:hypothetical protein
MLSYVNPIFGLLLSNRGRAHARTLRRAPGDSPVITLTY